MSFPSVSRFSRVKAIALCCGVAIFAAACSGGDSGEDIFAAAVEAANQTAESTASDQAAANGAASDGAGGDAGEQVAVDGFESDQDRYTALIQNSERFAQTNVGEGGRLALGVDCLEGYGSPTALITWQGNGLPVGEHKPDVTVGSVSVSSLIVRDVDVQDLPAGSTYSARQSGFGDAEYEFTFESLGVTLAVTGC